MIKAPSAALSASCARRRKREASEGDTAVGSGSGGSIAGVLLMSALLVSLTWSAQAHTHPPSLTGGMGRRSMLHTSSAVAVGSLLSPILPSPASAASRLPKGSLGATNEVVKTVNGMRHKRLGGSDIIVSEMGLGTQRWGSGDFNAPSEALCMRFMDRAILEGGVNLLDTAEQYPIPSTRANPEGDTERIIGKWLAQDKGRRRKVVIASKITGGRNVNGKSIIADCEASLQRLGTDYLDVYNLHWPARYSPQSNWGQSLE